MGIDVQTLILIIGVLHLMQFFVFYTQYKANKTISGPGWWLMWSGVEVLGFCLILLRSIPSALPVAIVFQNVVILLGTVFIYIGILKFFNKKIKFLFVTIFLVVFFILHLCFIFVEDNITIRTLILDIFLAIIAFVTAFSIHRNKTPNIRTTANFIALVFIIHGSVFIYRSIAIISGAGVIDVFASDFFNLIQYFDALIIGLLWTFGFIMMINQKLNNEILETKKHFEHIFNTSPDAVAISRLDDGVFIDCNENFVKLCGFSKNEIIGKSTIELKLYNNPEDRTNIMSQIFKHGYIDNIETHFQPKNAKQIIGLLSAKTTMISGIPHLISVTRNISHLRSTESELKLKNEQLQLLNAEKDKFFSIIAHDLKSPFNSIISLSELLMEQVKNKDYDGITNYSEIILQSSHRAMALLTNLMDWSLSQTGRMSFVPEFFELSHLINEVTLLFSDIAVQKSIGIKMNLPSKLPVYADPTMISAILRNLISNAIKFTEPGGIITITAKTTDTNLIVSVSDTGIGISEAKVAKLFRLAENNSTPGTQNEQGTGLGLLLCKEFVDKHKGEIWVESTIHKGSTFNFSIPQQKNIS